MKIVQKISDEKKEEIVLLYCKGFTKTEIVSRTGVTWWHINAIIYNLESKVASGSLLQENLHKVRETEKELINMAEQIAAGKDGLEIQYNVLLSCFASSDLNNYGVFFP